MKIHCAQLVEGALRSALDPKSEEIKPAATPPPPQPDTPNLLDSFTKPKDGGVRLVFLDEKVKGGS